MNRTTRELSDRHEKFLAKIFKGHRARGSGNQFHDQMDGRNDHRSMSVAFAWDGKATLGKSIGVSLAMWSKAIAQAHHEFPMIALRFYESERLDRAVDLVVVEAQTMADLLGQLDSTKLEDLREDIETLLTRCIDFRHLPVGEIHSYQQGEIHAYSQVLELIDKR